MSPGKGSEAMKTWSAVRLAASATLLFASFSGCHLVSGDGEARTFFDRYATKIKASDLSVTEMFAPDAVLRMRQVFAETGKDQVHEYRGRELTHQILGWFRAAKRGHSPFCFGAPAIVREGDRFIVTSSLACSEGETGRSLRMILIRDGAGALKIGEATFETNPAPGRRPPGKWGTSRSPRDCPSTRPAAAGRFTGFWAARRRIKSPEMLKVNRPSRKDRGAR